MWKYILRRALYAIPILLGISIVGFVLLRLAPGDPITALIPQDVMVSPEQLGKWRAELGLDQPAYVQYLRWLKQVLSGNLGRSFSHRRPITELIAVRLPPTLILMGFALGISTILGIVLGTLSAVRQYSWVDYFFTFLAFAWLSIPSFFLSLIMIYVFAVKLNALPAFGMTTAGATNRFLDVAMHLILPGFTLGFELTAALMRYVRSSLLEVMRLDYVRTARAKGLSYRRVIYRHALPNALIPVLTIISLRLPALIGGAVVIESVFTWPGLGTLILQAANTRDYPLVLAMTLLISTMVVASNLLADVSYAIVDPRIRYE